MLLSKLEKTVNTITCLELLSRVQNPGILQVFSSHKRRGHFPPPCILNTTKFPHRLERDFPRPPLFDASNKKIKIQSHSNEMSTTCCMLMSYESPDVAVMRSIVEDRRSVSV
jgi:hypothetical protein